MISAAAAAVIAGVILVKLPSLGPMPAEITIAAFDGSSLSYSLVGSPEDDYAYRGPCPGCHSKARHQGLTHLESCSSLVCRSVSIPVTCVRRVSDPAESTLASTRAFATPHPELWTPGPWRTDWTPGVDLHAGCCVAVVVRGRWRTVRRSDWGGWTRESKVR